MDFALTPKQRDVFEAVGALGKEKFAKRAAKYDELAQTPRDNMRDFFEAGMLGLCVPMELGGMGSGVLGPDPLLYLLAIEQTARYCCSTAHSLQIHCHGAVMVDGAGTKEQRERILGAVIERGGMLNGTGSEPGRTARGLYNIITIAERTNNGYILNGKKNYASLADAVDYNILAAGIKDVPLPGGHLMVMIPTGAAGFTIEPGSWNPMGMRAAVSPNLLMKDCFVGDENVLGEPGFYARTRFQAKFHLGFSAQYLGAAEGVIDFLREYIPKRGTAGDHYAQLRMGEIRIGTDSVRYLIHRAAWLWQQGNLEDAELASMVAKHKAIENMVVCMDKAAQIAGSSAFLEGSVLARIFRDMRMQTLHENPDKTAATVGQHQLGQKFDTTSRL